MEWMDRNKNYGRLAALALFVAAVIGPWAYTSDGLPPPEWCAAPNFLLKSGYCARQVSGLEILSFWVGAYPNEISWLANGDASLTDRIREFSRLLLLTVVIILLLLPIFTTLLNIWGRDSHRLRIFNLGTWGVAAVMSLLPLQFGMELISDRYWGIWLYLGLACVVVILEAVLLKANLKSRGASQL